MSYTPVRGCCAPAARVLDDDAAVAASVPALRRQGYEGDTVASVPHGRGSYEFPNPHFRYQGDFKQGVPHGRGVLTLGDGGSYEGEFVDGEIEGQGVRRWADGATYMGTFHCGEFNGEGTMTSPSGHRYEGQWKLNQHHGRGVWERADGAVVEGEFQHHLPHGRCVERGPNGELRDGDWRHGCLHGHASWRGADGSWYEGDWEEGRRHGRGRGYDAVSGIEYLGPYRDDAPVDEPKQVELRLVEAPTAEAEEAEGKEAEADQPEAPPSAEVLRRPAAPIELGAGAAIPDVAAFCTRGTGAEEEGGEGPPGDCTTWESGRVLEVRLMGPFTTDEELAAQQAEAEAAAKAKGKSKGKGKEEEEEEEEAPPEKTPEEKAAVLAASLGRRHVHPLVVERERARFLYRHWEDRWRARDPDGAAALDERVEAAKAAEAAAKAKATKGKGKGQPEEEEEPAPDPEAGCARVECVHVRGAEGQARFPSLRLPHDLLPGRYALHVREVVVTGGVAAEKEGEERWQSELAALAAKEREAAEQRATAAEDGEGKEEGKEEAEGEGEEEGEAAGQEDPIATLPPPYGFSAGKLWAAEVEIHVQ